MLASINIKDPTWLVFLIRQNTKDSRFDSTLITLKQYTTDLDSTSRLNSVTQERDLDEFLNTAQLAATDFTAGNVQSELHPQCLFFLMSFFREGEY